MMVVFTMIVVIIFAVPLVVFTIIFSMKEHA